MTGPPILLDENLEHEVRHRRNGVASPREDGQMVPLSQTEEMAAVLTASGVPHDLLVFDDEQHRFCRTESRKCAHRAELAFHGTMFGL